MVVSLIQCTLDPRVQNWPLLPSRKNPRVFCTDFGDGETVVNLSAYTMAAISSRSNRTLLRLHDQPSSAESYTEDLGFADRGKGVLGQAARGTRYTESVGTTINSERRVEIERTSTCATGTSQSGGGLQATAGGRWSHNVSSPRCQPRPHTQRGQGEPPGDGHVCWEGRA